MPHNANNSDNLQQTKSPIGYLAALSFSEAWRAPVRGAALSPQSPQWRNGLARDPRESKTVREVAPTNLYSACAGSL